MLLSEVANLESVTGFDLAGVWLVYTCEHSQQSGFSSTVEADDDHLAALIDREINRSKYLE